jgi:pimeloyl-ACP methyl ester carboxylesterase
VTAARPARAVADEIGLTAHGTGVPVLLLHGGGPGNNGDLTWHAVTASLPGGFRTLVADLPSTVTATAAPAPPPGARPPGARPPGARLPGARPLAAELAGLLERLGLRGVVVVGHSAGGRVACHLADLAADRVDRLVVLSSGALSPDGNTGADGELTPKVLRVLGFGERARDAAEYAQLWRDTVADRRSLDLARIAAAHARWMASFRPGPAGAALRWHRQEQEAVWPVLPRLTLPVLLLWGRDDRAAPWWRARALVDAFPDAELRVIPRAGHMVVWDQPAAVARAIAGFARPDD